MNVGKFGEDDVRPAIGCHDVPERNIRHPVHGRQPDNGSWKLLPETHESSEEMGFFSMSSVVVAAWGFSCASFGLVAPVTASVTDVMALWMRFPMFVALAFSQCGAE